jgi:hypothetical protein
MLSLQNTRQLIGSAFIAALFALSATAAEPGAETAGSPAAPAGAAAAGGDAAPAPPTVTLPESTVLPTAPKVGDTAPAAPKAAPDAAKVGDTAPAAPTGGAPPTGSPDWPCVQRKVATLTSAQIWDGPPVDDLKGWEGDEKITELTSYLESRRVSLQDAEKAIKEFSASLPQGERDQKLTQLFASVLAKINTDRQFVIGRIEEFQRRQKARSEELEREGQKLAEKNQAVPAGEQLGPMDANLTPEQQEYNWNARIFADRQQNLTVACEIPILIEQRAYEIGKLIRAQMTS